MDNVFNFKRFSQLFIKHTQEYYKIYLLSVVVLVGLLSVMLGFLCYANGGGLSTSNQFNVFSVFLIGAGSIFSSRIFSDLGNKRKSIALLTLPASHFEKYLVAWLYSFVIFQLVFILSFYTVDFVVLSVGTTSKDGGVKLMNLFLPESNYRMVALGFAFLHGLLFLGAIFFEKLHFIKTASVFFLLCLLVIFVNQQLANAIFGLELEKVIPFATASLREGAEVYRIDAESSIRPVMTGLTCTFVVLLWISAYFKLKEKQV